MHAPPDFLAFQQSVGRVDAGYDDGQEYRPPLLEAGRKGNQRPRHDRQFLARRLKYADDLRHDVDEHQRHDE